MDNADPFVSDDKETLAERLEKERQLRGQGLNPHELGSQAAKDLSDDMRGDQIDRSIKRNQAQSTSTNSEESV